MSLLVAVWFALALFTAGQPICATVLVSTWLVCAAVVDAAAVHRDEEEPTEEEPTKELTSAIGFMGSFTADEEDEDDD
jgi:hypothetical protein